MWLAVIIQSWSLPTSFVFGDDTHPQVLEEVSRNYVEPSDPKAAVAASGAYSEQIEAAMRRVFQAEAAEAAALTAAQRRQQSKDG